MKKFKKGDFALVQGQMVEILDVWEKSGTLHYQVEITKSSRKLTTWIDVKHIEPITNQKTPKVLYSKK